MILYHLEKWGRIASHWAVAAFFISALVILIYNASLLRSLLSHSDKASENVVTGTGVWANASSQQADNVQHIATDVRTTITKFNREIIPSTRKTLESASGALRGIQADADALKETAKAGTDLLASAQRTTDQMPTTLTTLNGAIGNIGDLAGTGNDSLNQFNALLSRKSLADTLDGLGTTATAAGKLSTDLAYWAHPILHPDPCTTAKCKWARAFAKVEALTGLAANSARASTLFTPMRVTIAH